MEGKVTKRYVAPQSNVLQVKFECGFDESSLGSQHEGFTEEDFDM